MISVAEWEGQFNVMDYFSPLGHSEVNEVMVPQELRIVEEFRS